MPGQGVFTLTADIEPVLDTRSFQREAGKLASAANTSLGKATTTATKQSQKQLGSLQKSMTATAQGFQVIEKTAVPAFTRTGQAAVATTNKIQGLTNQMRTFGTASVAAINQVIPGFRGATTAVEGFVGSLFKIVTATAKVAIGIIKVPATVKNWVDENRRLKASLTDIGNLAGGGGPLGFLPKRFGGLIANVIKGKSELDKAAKSGDKMAQSFLPVVQVLTILERHLDGIEFTLKQLDKNITTLTKHFVPLKDTMVGVSMKSNAPFGTTVRGAAQAAHTPGVALATLAPLTAGSSAAAGAAAAASTAAAAASTGVFATGIKKVKDGITSLIEDAKDLKGAFKESFSESEAEAQRFLDLLKKMKKETQDLSGTAGTRVVRPEVAAGKNLALSPGPPSALAAAKPLLALPAAGESGLWKTVEEEARRAGLLTGENFTEGVKKALPAAGGTGFGPAAADVFKGIGAQAEPAAQTLAGRFFKALRDRFKSEAGSTTAGTLAAPLQGLFSGIKGVAGGITSLVKAPFKAITGAVSGLAGALGGLNIAGLAGGAGIAAFGAAALHTAAKFETLETALDGVFGNGKETLKLFADFASKTPFELEQVAQAGLKLRSSFENLAPRSVIAILNEIGGAVASVGGGGETIDRIVLAMTQMQAAGKITADNLRQVTEALPSVSKAKLIDNLAVSLGKTRAQAQEMLNNGLVPARVGLESLLQAMHDVPGAQDAINKQAKTFSGLMSTLHDDLTSLKNEAGQPILEAFKNALEIVISLLPTATELVKDLAQGIAQTFGWIEENVPLIGDLFKRLGKAAQDSANGIGAVGTSIEEAKAGLDPIKQAIVTANNDLIKSGKLAQAASGDMLTGNAKVQGAVAKAQEDALSSNVAYIKTLFDVKSAMDAQSDAAKAATQAQEAYDEAIRQHNDELAKDRLRLTKEQTEANDKLAESDAAVTDATKALNDALAGASPEELERADIALTEAKIRLKDAIAGEQAAQEALNKSQHAQVDLAGLTLDQIRNRLAVVRRSLAAGASVPKKDKAEDAALQASLDRRSAVLDVKDAETEIQKLKAEGLATDPAVITAQKQLADAKKDQSAAADHQLEVQKELDALNGPDLEFNKTLKGLKDGIADAQEREHDAGLKLKEVRAQARGDEEGVRDALLAELEKYPELVKQAQDKADAEERSLRASQAWTPPAAFLPPPPTNLPQPGVNQAEENLSKAVDTLNAAIKTGNITNIQSAKASAKQAFDILQSEFTRVNTKNPIVLSAINMTLDHLAKAADKANKEIARIGAKTGVQLGAAQGGVFSHEAIRRIGEAGKEVVLPLTRPARMLALMSRSDVLNPILATLPRLQGSSLSSLNPAGLPIGAGRRSSRQERDQENRVLAEAIAEAVAGRISGALGDRGNFTLNQTVAHADPQVVARIAAYEVRKLLNGMR